MRIPLPGRSAGQNRPPLTAERALADGVHLTMPPPAGSGMDWSSSGDSGSRGRSRRREKEDGLRRQAVRGARAWSGTVARLPDEGNRWGPGHGRLVMTMPPSSRPPAVAGGGPGTRQGLAPPPAPPGHPEGGPSRARRTAASGWTAAMARRTISHSRFSVSCVPPWSPRGEA